MWKFVGKRVWSEDLGDRIEKESQKREPEGIEVKAARGKVMIQKRADG